MYTTGTGAHRYTTGTGMQDNCQDSTHERRHTVTEEQLWHWAWASGRSFTVSLHAENNENPIVYIAGVDVHCTKIITDIEPTLGTIQ